MSCTSHSSSGKHFNVVSYNSVLEQVSNLPDNKWMIYVLRHSHGLEDYATAKGSVKLKKRGKIFALIYQAMDAFGYVDYARRCILTLTINSASIVVCITPPLILVYRGC